MNKIIVSALAFALLHGLSAQTLSSIEEVSKARVTSPKPAVQTPAPSEDGKHVVQKGETLSSIARLYKTSFQSIALLNNLTSQTIKTGQILKVPMPAATAQEVVVDDRAVPQRKQRSASGLLYAKKQLTHTVQAGDDIYTISDNYDVKLAEIRRLNNLAANVVNFNIGEEIIYAETFEATNAEKVDAREIPTTPVEGEVLVEVESNPLEVTPPPAKQPNIETPVAPIPAPTPTETVVAPVETAVAGERLENGGFIGVEDKSQLNPYYIYHKTLKYGTKVRLHIPDNSGYVEAVVVNRLSAQRKEIIGISPACYRLIGGKAAANATISYLP